MVSNTYINKVICDKDNKNRYHKKYSSSFFGLIYKVCESNIKLKFCFTAHFTLTKHNKKGFTM